MAFFETNASRGLSSPHLRHVQAAARAHADASGLRVEDFEDLLKALAAKESAWEAGAIGSDGISTGLLQVIPGTASEFLRRPVSREELLDPALNADAGARVLAFTLARFTDESGSDMEAAVSAYNLGHHSAPDRLLDGQGNFRNAGYVADVMEYFRWYRARRAAGVTEERGAELPYEEEDEPFFAPANGGGGGGGGLLLALAGGAAALLLLLGRRKRG